MDFLLGLKLVVIISVGYLIAVRLDPATEIGKTFLLILFGLMVLAAWYLGYTDGIRDARRWIAKTLFIVAHGEKEAAEE